MSTGTFHAGFGFANVFFIHFLVLPADKIERTLQLTIKNLDALRQIGFWRPQNVENLFQFFLMAKEKVLRPI